VVHLYTASTGSASDEDVEVQKHVLWDRKAEGGFPGMFSLFHSHPETVYYVSWPHLLLHLSTNID